MTTCLTFRAVCLVDTSISLFIKHCANRTPTPTATHCKAGYFRFFTCTSTRNTRVDTVIVLLSFDWALDGTLLCWDALLLMQYSARRTGTARTTYRWTGHVWFLTGTKAGSTLLLSYIVVPHALIRTSTTL